MLHALQMACSGISAPSNGIYDAFCTFHTAGAGCGSLLTITDVDVGSGVTICGPAVARVSDTLFSTFESGSGGVTAFQASWSSNVMSQENEVIWDLRRTYTLFLIGTSSPHVKIPRNRYYFRLSVVCPYSNCHQRARESSCFNGEFPSCPTIRRAAHYTSECECPRLCNIEFRSEFTSNKRVPAY